VSLEQPAIIPFAGDAGREGCTLEGLYVSGSPEVAGGVLVAPPHPLYGGNIVHPVVTEIALRSQALGLTSLCFNWRGVGASAGTTSGDVEAAVEDYAAALDFFEASVDGPIVAAGYSWGGATALRAAQGRPGVRRLLLVAPPQAMLDRAALDDFTGEVFIAVGEHDELAGAAELEAIAAGSDKATFVMLADTDHFFASGTAELGRAAEAWLA
jgi:alpha/beta superfamily hydrolase